MGMLTLARLATPVKDSRPLESGELVLIFGPGPLRMQTLQAWWEPAGSHVDFKILKELDDSSVIPYKSKRTLATQASNCDHIPWYYSEGTENLCPQRSLCTYLDISLLHGCPNLEVTNVPLRR